MKRRIGDLPTGTSVYWQYESFSVLGVKPTGLMQPDPRGFVRIVNRKGVKSLHPDIEVEVAE